MSQKSLLMLKYPVHMGYRDIKHPSVSTPSWTPVQKCSRNKGINWRLHLVSFAALRQPRFQQEPIAAYARTGDIRSKGVAQQFFPCSGGLNSAGKVQCKQGKDESFALHSEILYGELVLINYMGISRLIKLYMLKACGERTQTRAVLPLTFFDSVILTKLQPIVRCSCAL